MEEMKTILIELEFEIGDRVYHITPESEVGIVIEWRTFGNHNVTEYLVSFGPTMHDWYYSQELSKTKLFYD